MKNYNQISLTSSATPNISSFHYSKSISKYKNVEFVPCWDQGYQAYRANFIEINNSKRPVGYVPQPQTNFQRASRIIEFILRTWIGSDNNRILKYDVYYKGRYHRNYREIDIVQFKNNGTLVLGEIKSSNKPNRSLASEQLQIASRIVSPLYKIILPTAIYTNTALDNIQEEFDGDVFSHSANTKTTTDGFSYNVINVSIHDIVNYATSKGLNVDLSIIEDARKDAKQSVFNRQEKNIRKQLERSAQASLNKTMLQHSLNQNLKRPEC